jgi:hypothetical protein
MGRKDTSAYDIYLREENGKTVVAVISSSSSNCTCSTDYETHLSRSHHLAKKIFSLSLSLSLQGTATTGGLFYLQKKKRKETTKLRKRNNVKNESFNISY